MTSEPADEPWLDVRPAMTTPRKVVLLALLASLFLLGGIQLERHLIADDGAASGSTSGVPGMPDLGSGGLPAGFPGLGGQAPLGGQATDTPDGAPDDSTTKVIGRVISSDGAEITVEDLGGKTHTLTLSETTKVHQDLAVDVADLKPGQTVVVEGEKTDGTTTATDITVR